MKRTKHMKSSHILGTAALLIILIAATLVVTAFNQPMQPTPNLATTSIRAQVTATPKVEDQSQVGSTDGIVIMGFVIVVIALTPVLLRKKQK